MNTEDFSLRSPSSDHEQFLDSYAENITLAMDVLEAIATELANVGDAQAASFYTGMSRAVSAFSAAHTPMTCLVRAAPRSCRQFPNQ